MDGGRLHVLRAPAERDGSYTIRGYDRAWFEYTELETFRAVPGAFEGWSPEAHIFLPAAAAISVPGQQALGMSLSIPFEDQGFQSGVAVVLDESGTVTWTSEPSSIDGMYDQNATSFEQVEIPADAFPSVGDYAVGFAGMTRTFPEDLVDLDAGMTAIRAGHLRFWHVTVIAEP